MSERELLFSVTKKDFVIDWYSGTGPGGQNKNKVKACVRLSHPDSGVTVTATEQRSREQNLKMAFKRMTEHRDFTAWLKKKAAELMLSSDEKRRIKEDIEHKVDESMRDENLLIEIINI